MGNPDTSLMSQVTETRHSFKTPADIPDSWERFSMQKKTTVTIRASNGVEEFITKLNEKFPKGTETFAEGFMAVPGRRLTKICMERTGTPVSAYGFINNETGELFRAASWASPAKHARGNINDDSALNACGRFGVAMLK